jgi:hypothetical protein
MFRRPPKRFDKFPIRPIPIRPDPIERPLPMPPIGIYPPIDRFDPIQKRVPHDFPINKLPYVDQELRDEIRRYKQTGEPSSILQNLPQNSDTSQYTELNLPRTLIPMQSSPSTIYENPNENINKNPNGDGAQSPKFQQLRQLMSKGPSK